MKGLWLLDPIVVVAAALNNNEGAVSEIDELPGAAYDTAVGLLTGGQ